MKTILFVEAASKITPEQINHARERLLKMEKVLAEKSKRQEPKSGWLDRNYNL